MPRAPVTTRRRTPYRPPRPVVTSQDAAQFDVDNLRDIIEYQGVRRPWLAKQMGYHDSWLSLILSGRRRPTPAFIARACSVLHLPPHILFSYRPHEDEHAADTA